MLDAVFLLLFSPQASDSDELKWVPDFALAGILLQARSDSPSVNGGSATPLLQLKKRFVAAPGGRRPPAAPCFRLPLANLKSLQLVHHAKEHIKSVQPIRRSRLLNAQNGE